MSDTNKITAESSNSSPSISWPSGRLSAQQPFTPEMEASFRANSVAPGLPSVSSFQPPQPPALPRDILPHGERSLSSISLHAFCLGSALGSCTLVSIFLAYSGSAFWRAPFFIAALSAFHFLEFWMTAAYNPPMATVSAFLLSNGPRYRQAHTAALIECIFTSSVFPRWQERVAMYGWLIGAGFVMVLVGQIVRSMAMIQAGTNFNHRVQTQRAQGHVLVTNGVYGWLRHPAYFGFFWWGIGTQLILGNVVCFCVYAGVLWQFFSSRIWSEEKFLISFFGNDYVKYRTRTRVGIPLIP